MLGGVCSHAHFIAGQLRFSDWLESSLVAPSCLGAVHLECRGLCLRSLNTLGFGSKACCSRDPCRCRPAFLPQRGGLLTVAHLDLSYLVITFALPFPATDDAAAARQRCRPVGRHCRLPTFWHSPSESQVPQQMGCPVASRPSFLSSGDSLRRACARIHALLDNDRCCTLLALHVHQQAYCDKCAVACDLDAM